MNKNASTQTNISTTLWSSAFSEPISCATWMGQNGCERTLDKGFQKLPGLGASTDNPLPCSISMVGVRHANGPRHGSYQWDQLDMVLHTSPNLMALLTPEFGAYDSHSMLTGLVPNFNVNWVSEKSSLTLAHKCNFLPNAWNRISGTKGTFCLCQFYAFGKKSHEMGHRPYSQIYRSLHIYLTMETAAEMSQPCLNRWMPLSLPCHWLLVTLAISIANKVPQCIRIYTWSPSCSQGLAPRDSYACQPGAYSWTFWINVMLSPFSMILPSGFLDFVFM